MSSHKNNILFVSHVSSQLRHFIGVLENLASRGHSITIMVDHKSSKPQELPEFLSHIPGLNIVTTLMAERPWGPYSRAIRGARNYLLYYDEAFKNALFFRDRCYGWVDKNLKAHIDRDERPDPAFVKWLEQVEDAIPPSRAIRNFLVYGGYDAVLVTPYIFYQNTYQTDYVKCSHHLGIPVGFPVFSWDNLTSKGNVQVLPDRIWVWNDSQRRELIDLHQVSDKHIGVMGAWRFDKFMQMTPSLSQAEFSAQYGFDGSKPLIAYLGSSPAIAPNEGEFVARWLRALRSHPDPLVASASVLVRAHPRNINAWKAASEITSYSNVAFQEPEASNLFESQGLLDVLSYSHAAIGLNTSALLEAAILRRPVHTVSDDQTASSHKGTVHYKYLTTVGGGLIHVAHNLDDHFEKLKNCLRRPLSVSDKRADAFAKVFIDADGPGPKAASNALADEIEQLAAMEKVSVRQTYQQYLRGWHLMAKIRLGFLKLDKDPDYVAPIERAVIRAGSPIIQLVRGLINRLDANQTIKAYLLVKIGHEFGYERKGPRTLSGVSWSARIVGSTVGVLCVACVRLGRVLGFHGFLNRWLGVPVSVCQLDLKKQEPQNVVAPRPLSSQSKDI